MTNGFAGSKSLDERRRRRLAQEGTEASGVSPRASRRRLRASLFSRSSDSSQAENSLHLSASAPVKTRLWREPWKYGALIALLLLFDVAIVLHANWASIRARETPTVVNVVESWIVEHLAVGYFTLATGFAWLIFYHRSRSRLDFGGRYRLWIWPAMLWTAITVCSLTGWHELCTEWVTGRTRFRGWNGRLWCWLIPTAAMLLSSTRLLTNEFTACRVSWRLHLSSVIMAAVAICCVLLQDTSLDGVWLIPTLTLATILWPTLELGSFLLFARHVVHVTNEPTTIARKKQKRKFSIGKLFKKLIAWILTTREELPAYEELPTTKSTRKRSPRRSTKSKSSSHKTRSASKSRVVETTYEDYDEEVESEELEGEQEPVRVEKPALSPPPMRVDKPAVITPPRVEKPAITPQASQAKPVQPVARAAEPIKPPAKLAETRPGTQLRADAPQAKKGPHFAQANQRQEREAVAALRREPERMEDDFGDVDDWEEDDGDAPQHKRMKGKKKRRR